MYLVIITLPLLSAIISGLLGRKIGVTGAQILTSASITITSLLALIAFYEVALSSSPVSINLCSWLDSESLKIDWAFNFDALTVSMLLPVLIVSSLVHVYSAGYMSEDPHQQRFFSYLSLFTFFMVILVTGDNYLVMFIGWEGVGIVSYLLISFWFTRVQANKAAISALLFNRVGDLVLIIGLFALIFTLGNLNYASCFALAPYLNETIVTIACLCFLVGACAKSAQLGLHVWLANSMEGDYLMDYALDVYCDSTLSSSDPVLSKIVLSEHPDSGIIKVQVPSPNNQFSTATYCIAEYVREGNDLLKIPKAFASGSALITEVSQEEIQGAIIGDLLGDGNLGASRSLTNTNNNAALHFTFSDTNLPLLEHLRYVVYNSLCTSTCRPNPWPNSALYPGCEITQYTFSSRSLPMLTAIHSQWYVPSNEPGQRYTKILPKNIGELLTPIGLAHWIMGDGFRSQKRLGLCTDNFTFAEVQLLVEALRVRFGINATIANRKRTSGVICWRIKVSAKSMALLRSLVVGAIHILFQVCYIN